MAFVYLIDGRPDRFVALDWDEANDEVTDLVYENLTDTPWSIKYKYHNRPLNEVTIPAQTPESRIAVPPGQRQFVAQLEGPGQREGYSSEIERVSG